MSPDQKMLLKLQKMLLILLFAELHLALVLHEAHVCQVQSVEEEVGAVQ